MSILYNIFIHLLIFGMKVFSFFNDKTKKGIEGRKQSVDIIKSKLSTTDKVIWMHAASLGEYEQGLPVLEKLKERFPSNKILVTFFSPSGYDNVVKKKNIADVICYLPFDTKRDVSDFLSYLNIELFFTVKYDYWYNLLNELKNNNIRTYVISAMFYENQSFFTSYGKWFVKQLKNNITWFFHQTQHSYFLAKSIGLVNASVTGDTRFDRVKKLKNRDNHVDFIHKFIGHDKAIVFGSSWQAEEKLAKMIFEKNQNVKLMIAPHDLKRVENLKNIFPNAMLYSELSSPKIQSFNSTILIIDSIGLLSKLYSFADIAVVGGGFHDSGLHNILEAATFDVPVIFGDHYKKNPEADDLIKFGGAKSFEQENEAAEFVLYLLNNNEELKTMSENAGKFVSEQPDSSELIMKKILSF
ncbi:glycosyltransferase N-terminal domain-containing protein [Chryseobacterium wangxinyae]|uniref:3-deoxy-D-manno-octulosonic acid transferase n=1 Tax=Chryseobacterium sp. CY350 TaxID=2997336 RepID=UPI0022701247|nr:glycosyltransferase N-terminal domain-containing protein [Chryseobacterium sp. CY350]MCY0978767.1 3-deoxy-D-manno-octulosonic acid transferase [Chryseobacterium sp. CY350]WBZ93852.1 glycosyltransferase N-terminal domain-containing protein [Chryseobacterium sp. CY350]